MRHVTTICLAAALLAPLPASAAETLGQAIAWPGRDRAAVARDPARHPDEVLSFLGVKPESSIAEIFPYAGYWTEILAPYLHDKGALYAVLGDPAGNENERAYARFPDRIRAEFAAHPEKFDKIRYTYLGGQRLDFLPANSVDVVLTFRNLHTWMHDKDVEQVLASFYRALKPGGTFGIEEHRARPDRPQDPVAEDGYVRQDYAVAMIERAGFRLLASSELERNPRDTTHWPRGVWTLPPTYRLGAVDHDKYKAIGEADNFLLRFQKPL